MVTLLDKFQIKNFFKEFQIKTKKKFLIEYHLRLKRIQKEFQQKDLVLSATVVNLRLS